MRGRGFSRFSQAVERDLLACARVVRSSSGTVALAAVEAPLVHDQAPKRES